MHIVHGELRKPPFVKQGCGQDGQSTMFIVELSEVIKDYKTGEKTYTNYSAVLFAKSPAHVDHYYSTLVDGNFIVVTGDKLKIDISESNGKQYIKLQVENASLEGSGYVANQQAQQGGHQQGGYQQAAAPQGYQPQQQGGYQQQAPRQQAPAPQGNYQQHKQGSYQQGK